MNKNAIGFGNAELKDCDFTFTCILSFPSAMRVLFWKGHLTGSSSRDMIFEIGFLGGNLASGSSNPDNSKRKLDRTCE